MLVKSKITGKKYDPVHMVNILNMKQATLSMKFGVELIDIFVSENHKTGEPVLVFMFDRESTRKAYDLWCKGELK